MKKVLNVLGLVMIATLSFGQAMTTAADSDPAAKKILDKLKAEYDTYVSMRVNFDLVMELPGQDVEVQKGSVTQQGEMYKLELDERSIYSNNEFVWVHIKKNNEVQINDADMDEEANMLSPKDMLKLYESGEFVYVISGEPLLDGKKVTQIEFKPLDRDSEFSKMVLFVDKKSTQMSQMKVFSKDGGRYTLVIKEIIPNEKYGLSEFTFDESKYPDIHVEDLRID